MDVYGEHAAGIARPIAERLARQEYVYQSGHYRVFDAGDDSPERHRHSMSVATRLQKLNLRHGGQWLVLRRQAILAVVQRRSWPIRGRDPCHGRDP